MPFPDGVDLFGSHHAALPDGQILIVGGALPFDTPGTSAASTRSVSSHPKPIGSTGSGGCSKAACTRRLVELADGDYAVFSGFTAAPSTGETIADSVELLGPPFFLSRQALYRTACGSPARRAVLPTYPGLLLVPGGALFYLGTTWQYAGAGRARRRCEDAGADLRADDRYERRIARPGTTCCPNRLQPHREEGTFVLLPPAQAGRILVVGGGHIQNYDTDPNADLPPRARRRPARR